MKLLDWLILAVIAILMILALRSLKKNHCTGNCMGCSGCDFAHTKKIIEDRKQNKSTKVLK